MRWISEPIVNIHIRSIVIMDAINLLMTVTFVNMSKYMCLGFDILYEFEKPFATCVLFSDRKIQYTIWWAMRNEHINIIWDSTPKLLALILTVHKAPVKELWRIRRSKYSNAFYLDHFMLQICTNFFQFLDFLFGIEWGIFVFEIFQFLLIGLSIEGEIVVACNDYLVFIGYHFQKLSESFKLGPS